MRLGMRRQFPSREINLVTDATLVLTPVDGLVMFPLVVGSKILPTSLTSVRFLPRMGTHV